MNTQKKPYEPPQLKVVEFKVDRGFALSFTAMIPLPPEDEECYRDGGSIWDEGQSFSTGFGSNESYKNGGSLF